MAAAPWVHKRNRFGEKHDIRYLPLTPAQATIYDRGGNGTYRRRCWRSRLAATHDGFPRCRSRGLAPPCGFEVACRNDHCVRSELRAGAFYTVEEVARYAGRRPASTVSSGLRIIRRIAFDDSQSLPGFYKVGRKLGEVGRKLGGQATRPQLGGVGRTGNAPISFWLYRTANGAGRRCGQLGGGLGQATRPSAFGCIAPPTELASPIPATRQDGDFTAGRGWERVGRTGQRAHQGLLVVSHRQGWEDGLGGQATRPSAFGCIAPPTELASPIPAIRQDGDSTAGSAAERVHTVPTRDKACRVRARQVQYRTIGK